MSIDIIKRVIQLRQVSPTEKSILYGIAEACDPCGHGYISFGGLVVWSNLDERAIKRVVAKLVEEDKLLHISKTKAKGGKNIYTILFPDAGVVRHEGNCKRCKNKGVMVIGPKPIDIPEEQAKDILKVVGINPESSLYSMMLGRNGTNE